MKIGVTIVPFNYELRKARKDRGLTQKEMADRVGINVGTYGEIERLMQPKLSTMRMRMVIDAVCVELERERDELFPQEYLDAFMHKRLAGRSWARANEKFRWIELDLGLLTSENLDRPMLPDEVHIDVEKLRGDLDRTLSEYLPHREKEVVLRRSGLYSANGSPQLLEEVGEALGVTRERVRQLEAQAWRRLRCPQIRQKLGKYRDILGDGDDEGIV